jgi:bifunctional polynucleotide phosphatase/kinase
MDWTNKVTYIKGIYNGMDIIHTPVRIASFDLDDTLIFRPTSSKKGKDKDSTNDINWILLQPELVDKITELVTKNYLIIVFTNQSSLSKGGEIVRTSWKKSVDQLRKNIFSKVVGGKYYFAVYAATGHDIYRKPNTGMFQLMKDDLSDYLGTKVKISKKSFFCGDAAGRQSPSYFKKKIYPSTKTGDFSDTDRKFALNIKFPFCTPETFYLGESDSSYQLEGFNPVKFMETYSKSKTVKYQFVPRKQELIILIGMPGSGKSEFYRQYIKDHGYLHINQDTCLTQKKCIEMATTAFRNHQSVVIDNTNPDATIRNNYISIAMANGYTRIRAIVLLTDIEIAKHLNNVRHLYSNGTIPKVPDIAYHIFKKKFLFPTIDEHYDKIESIPFSFDKSKLEDPKWYHLFMKWS